MKSYKTNMLKKNKVNIKDDIYTKFNLIEQEEVRFLSFVSFILLAVIGIIFAICDPYTPIILYISACIILANLICVLIICSNPKRFRIFFELYVGINCISIGVVCLISYIKIIYLTLSIKSPLFWIVSILIYIALLLYFFIASIRKYNNSIPLKNKKIMPIAVLAPVIGFLIARLIQEHTSQEMGLLILCHFLLALSYITTVGVEKVYLYCKIKSFLKTKSIKFE